MWSDIATPERLLRRLRQLVVGLWLCALVGTVGMVAGAGINDYRIESQPGRALAVVTGVGILRTTVDFQDQEGIVHSPPGGVLYPSGLGEGQRVWVTYDKSDPDLVKVENRRWTLSIIPAASVLVVATLIAVALWLLVGVLMARWERYREAARGRRRTASA